MTSAVPWDKATIAKRMYEHHLRFPNNQYHWRRFQRVVWSLDKDSFQCYGILVGLYKGQRYANNPDY